jgi:molecular chaperone GrpE (heat shock protein)
MPIPEAPRVSKWPFLLGDLLLVGLAGFVIATASWPLSRWEIGAVALCFVTGAWLAVIPFLREHSGAVKLWEQSNLAEAAQQLDRLVTLANQISAATGEWRGIQETAATTNRTAGEITQKMSLEAKAFSDFLQRHDAQEKAALRLEIDKLRRNEGETLQVIVHLQDHIYALFLAGVRTGQSPLVQQLGQFRAACLDTVRRIGLVAHEARPGEEFDPKAHQTPDGKEPEPGSRIEGTIACGYTYQGQAVRRILVALAAEPTTATTSLPAVDASELPGLTTSSTIPAAPAPQPGEPESPAAEEA